MIRPEQHADHDAVRRLYRAAFPTPAEARLVDELRRRARPLVSLVAEEDGRVVGHILFSPVMLDPDPELALMGLAPMAVEADRRGRGIGSALAQEGLAACRALGADAVFVLGHPDYYPRFGFAPAVDYGIGCVYDVPDEAFMAIALTRGCLDRAAGTVRYHPAFDAL